MRNAETNEDVNADGSELKSVDVSESKGSKISAFGNKYYQPQANINNMHSPMTEKDVKKHKAKNNSGSVAGSSRGFGGKFETNSDTNNNRKVSSMLDKQNPQPA